MSGRITADAETLRREFDARFITPQRVADVALERLIVIRAADDVLLIRLGEIAALARCPRVTGVPSAASGLLGVVGLRGALIAVFDLATVLGARGPEPKWIVTCSSNPSVAFAFASYHGHATVAQSEVSMPEKPANPHVAGAVIIEGALRAILDLKRLLADLGGGMGARSNR